MVGILAMGSLALLSVLVVLIVVFKARRDRRESSSTRRRDRYRHAIVGEDRARLRDLARAVPRNEFALLDLVWVLDTLGAGAVAPDGALMQALRDTGTVDRLRRQLRSRRPTRRGRAALALSRLHPPDIPGRLAALLGDPDDDVRILACACLARVGSPSAARLMLDALEAGRIPASRLVERLAAPWAVEVLIDEVSAAESTIRAPAAEALGLAGDRRGVGALVELAGAGQMEERIAAVRALGRLGSAAGGPAVAAALGDEVWEVRAQAARAAGELGLTEAVGALGALLGDPAWTVRANAGVALRHLGPAGRAQLREALGHPDPYARDRAAEELALADAAQRHHR